MPYINEKARKELDDCIENMVECLTHGNNVTNEEVIRNQFELDEGDPFNILLTKKSINNLRSTNLFKSVNYKVNDGSDKDSKVIDITVEEKATGELTAGAGFGTDGGTPHNHLILLRQPKRDSKTTRENCPG